MQLIGTVSEAVAITNGGMAVFFTESPNHIITFSSFDVVITRPDGISTTFAASREFARKLSAPGGEVIGLLIRSASISDVPVGSIVFIA